MEFGDIIYFILLVFFMILGFFNDSRKKKNQQKQLEQEEAASSNSDRELSELPPQPPRHFPPAGKTIVKDKGKTVFQSSLDQVEDFSKYETGETIDFDYDADSVEDDFEYSSSVKPQLARYASSTTPAMPETPQAPMRRRTSDGKNRGGVHPLVSDLHQSDGLEAIKKGVIYSEILNRKY